MSNAFFVGLALFAAWNTKLTQRKRKYLFNELAAGIGWALIIFEIARRLMGKA